MNNRKGLSEIVSTLILLVVAVLLAAVATYYATNITMTRTENEQLQLSKAHIWVNSTGAIAAFKLQNLGGKDILMDKISVRGVDSAWSTIFVYRIPSGTTFTDDLTVCNYTDMSGGFTHAGETYSTVSADIPLSSGSELLVYIINPDNVQVDDIGTSISLAVYTNNANYITEVNVQSATTH
jgi:flagellin-like protein